MYLSKSFYCLSSTRKGLLKYFLVFEIGNYKLKVLLYLLHRKILTLNFLPINFKIIFKNSSKQTDNNRLLVIQNNKIFITTKGQHSDALQSHPHSSFS